GRGAGSFALSGLVFFAGGLGVLSLGALTLGLVLAAFLFAVLALRLVIRGLVLRLKILFAELLAKLDRAQQVADGARKGVLIVDRIDQAVEVSTCLVFQPVAPEGDQTLAALRYRLAGQALAHHKRDGIFNRRILAAGAFHNRDASVPLLEHRRDVVGHAQHGAGA